MKRKLLALILLLCVSFTFNGCVVYSHNYDKWGNEMNESEVDEKIGEIMDEIIDEINDNID